MYVYVCVCVCVCVSPVVQWTISGSEQFEGRRLRGWSCDKDSREAGTQPPL